MNIQIFGTKKCFETKKAERYFKERNIKYQMIDLKEKEISRGEFNNIIKALGNVELLVDEKCKDNDLRILLNYLDDEAKKEKIFENQHIIKTPIVRNGKFATIGVRTDIWKNWE